mmetsp:Transcript_37700/g.70312  ORF Transcript_37700/g.70312 Transcript_37700/m.70312 type:complete len:128 (+) Transcript_37700:315-698(+)
MVRKEKNALVLIAVRSRSHASSNSARQVSISPPLPLPFDARSGDRCLLGDSDRRLLSTGLLTKRGGGSGDGDGVTLTLRTPRVGPGDAACLGFFSEEEEEEEDCFRFRGAVIAVQGSRNQRGAIRKN